MRGGAKIEFQERARGMRQRKKMRGPMAQLQRNSRSVMATMPIRIAPPTLSAIRMAISNKSHGGEKHLRIGGFAEPDERGGIRDDDFGVAHSDERDEEADSRGGAVLQAIGNVVDDVLANIGERQKQKNACRKETRRRAPSATARAAPMHDRNT